MAVWKFSRENNFVKLCWRAFAINPNQPSMSHLMLLLLLLLFFCFDKLTIGRGIKKKVLVLQVRPGNGYKKVFPMRDA